METKPIPGTHRYTHEKMEFYKSIVRDELGFDRMKRAEREWAERFASVQDQRAVAAEGTAR